jgi:hypothetical protein
MVTLVAGCGGDDDDADGDSRGTTTEGTGAQDPADDPRGASERADDQAAAEAMLLTLADFPSGWEETPADEADDENDELSADTADCLGVDPDELDPDNPKATSPSFSSSDDDEASVEVAFTPSEEAATRALELLADEAAPGCYGEAIQVLIEDNAAQEDLPEGIELGEATFNRLSFASLGDESTAFRVTLPFSAEGLNIDYFLDVVFVRVGRIGITGQFQAVVTPFDEAHAAELMQTVIDRASAE